MTLKERIYMSYVSILISVNCYLARLVLSFSPYSLYLCMLNHGTRTYSKYCNGTVVIRIFLSFSDDALSWDPIKMLILLMRRFPPTLHVLSKVFGMLLYLSFKFYSSWKTLSSGKIHFIDYISKRRTFIPVNFEAAYNSWVNIK